MRLSLLRIQFHMLFVYTFERKEIQLFHEVAYIVLHLDQDLQKLMWFQ